MAPGELWWLIEAMTPQQMKAGDVEEMYQAMRESQAAERGAPSQE